MKTTTAALATALLGATFSAATGRENRAIDWRFQVGDVVKIRVHGA